MNNFNIYNLKIFAQLKNNLIKNILSKKNFL